MAYLRDILGGSAQTFQEVEEGKDEEYYVSNYVFSTFPLSVLQFKVFFISLFFFWLEVGT